MGLDMYLRYKNKFKLIETQTKDCCGGLFGIGIVTDTEELGYWRKAWSVHKLIMDAIQSTRKKLITENNCVDFFCNDEVIEKVLKTAANKYEDLSLYHIEKYKETDEYWEAQEWYDTVEAFKKAQALRQASKNNKIYYSVWY